jgi:hypothetical protein
MRTFPRELETFRKMIEERGQKLRLRSFAELKEMGNAPLEELMVNDRKATIGTIVLTLPSGGIQLVLQGFMDGKWFRWIKNVALDGFYKYPDETIAEMKPEEFYSFD